MVTTVLFFASLRESLGIASTAVELPPGVTTVAALRDHLATRGDAWLALTQTRNLRAAVNLALVKMDAEVKDGDEVAFFPPVTGG